MTLFSYAKKKAAQSTCRFKISAIGLDKKNDIIGSTFNAPRFNRLGGGLHAEMRLMARYGKNLKTILILRVGNNGTVLPIHPCRTCAEKAKSLGIKIIGHKETKE
jgi:hypothetical protein